jgi:molybdopterin converting factor small subunit
MDVTVKLFAHYRNGRYNERLESLPEGASVRDVILPLGVDQPDDPIGIILINGRHAKRDAELHDGDVLAIFPMVGGG